MKTLISIVMACALAIAPPLGGADLVFVARVFLAFIRRPIVDERIRQAFDSSLHLERVGRKPGPSVTEVFTSATLSSAPIEMYVPMSDVRSTTVFSPH